MEGFGYPGKESLPKRMKVIPISDPIAGLSSQSRSQIQQLLGGDQVLVYPTDTLYGIGVDACSDKAVAELYRLKARESSPVSVLLESTVQLLDVTEGLTELARELITQFLPGPLTVICHSAYPFAQKLISPQGTVGFRVPGDQISRQIPKLYGGPITTTSVNPAGEAPACSRVEVVEYYEDQIALMLDIGELKPSKGSTVIDLTTRPFKMLREGEISRHTLLKYLN